MTATLEWTGFAEDPMASHSAQFPLGGPQGLAASLDAPSSEEVRPWGLRAMRPVQLAEEGSSLEGFTYDHVKQLAIDGRGRHIDIKAASAESNTSKDGDEGPSEDWKYDFAPDADPFAV